MLISEKAGSQKTFGTKVRVDFGKREIFDLLADKRGNCLIRLLDLIVYNIETDALITQNCGYLQISTGRGEVSRGVVVNDYIAK